MNTAPPQKASFLLQFCLICRYYLLFPVLVKHSTENWLSINHCFLNFISYCMPTDTALTTCINYRLSTDWNMKSTSFLLELQLMTTSPHLYNPYISVVYHITGPIFQITATTDEEQMQDATFTCWVANQQMTMCWPC